MLTNTRKQKWIKQLDKEWEPIGKSLHVVLGTMYDYFTRLSEFKQVETIALPWTTRRSWSSLNDTQNILVRKFYQWTVSKPLDE